MTDREQALSDAFVSIATRLATGYDEIDLFEHLTESCVALLDVSAAGLLLADGSGTLHVLAATSERTRQLEAFQVQRDEGPCRDCYQSGEPVAVSDLTEAGDRWPMFAKAAVEAGFLSVQALPLRLRSKVLGALGLFRGVPGTLDEADTLLGQSLADVASVALVQSRVADDAQLVSAQLQTALTSRITVEQAKGILAQVLGLDMNEAFMLLRRYARDNNLMLTAVAASLVARELPTSALADHQRQRRS